MVIKVPLKTKDRAGTGNAGNRTVVCLDDTPGLIVNSSCFNTIIVPRALLLVKTSSPTVCYNWGYSVSAEKREA